MMQVLDKGFVELIDMMGNEFSIVNAARVSTANNKKDTSYSLCEKDKKLLKYLYDNRHHSPFEHCIMKFHIKTPIFIARQWMRHRIASYNELSGRYSEIKPDFYIPDKWREQDTNNKQGSNDIIDNDFAIKTGFEQIITNCFSWYENALKASVSKEMARMILPLNTYTEFYWTINLRSLINFLEQRMHRHAQWEIRQYAKVIMDIVKDKLPYFSEIFIEDLKKRGIINE